jgi:hypothetical protein
MNRKGMEGKWLWPNLSYDPSTFVDSLKKTTETFSQDSHFLDQDLNAVPRK